MTDVKPWRPFALAVTRELAELYAARECAAWLARRSGREVQVSSATGPRGESWWAVEGRESGEVPRDP